MGTPITSNDRVKGYLFSFSYAPALNLKSSPELKGTFMGMTVMTALSYIPGVSLIVGIVRMIFSQLAPLFSHSHDMGFDEYPFILAIQESQIVRGAMEFSSILCPLLLIADIALTVLMIACD